MSQGYITLDCRFSGNEKQLKKVFERMEENKKAYINQLVEEEKSDDIDWVLQMNEIECDLCLNDFGIILNLHRAIGKYGFNDYLDKACKELLFVAKDTEVNISISVMYYYDGGGAPTTVEVSGNSKELHAEFFGCKMEYDFDLEYDNCDGYCNECELQFISKQKDYFCK